MGVRVWNGGKVLLGTWGFLTFAQNPLSLSCQCYKVMNK